ncbi:restriction endonuclease subunit S [Mycoplasma sp. AC157]
MSNNTKNNLVPSLRFKEFTHAWEQEVLGNLLISYRNKNKSNLSLESYSITNSSGFVNQKDFFQNGGKAVTANKRNSLIVEPFSFAYNPARIDIGSIGYYNKGKNVLISPLYEVFKTVNYIEDNWMFLWFKSKNFKEIINKNKEGSVRLCLYIDKLDEEKIILPKIEEQEKNSKLILLIDSLLSLHKRKYNFLKNIKNTLLDKMFPSQNSNIPSIRFKEFTHAWEQDILGNISYFENGDSYEKYAKESGKYKIINLNSVSIEGKLQENGKRTDFAKQFLRKDDLVMILSDIGEGKLIGKTAIIPENSLYVLNQRVALVRINEQYKSNFFSNQINSKQYLFRQKSGGSAQLNLSKNEILNFEIFFPTFNEQNKICTLFDNLDSLISLHKRKLTALENIKAKLLEKMFV